MMRQIHNRSGCRHVIQSPDSWLPSDNGCISSTGIHQNDGGLNERLVMGWEEGRGAFHPDLETLRMIEALSRPSISEIKEEGWPPCDFGIERYPNYTLVVEAADMQGEGLSGQAKVNLTVTDSNNNASAFPQSSVPVLQFPTTGDGLRRRKRDWVIPDLKVSRMIEDPIPKVSQFQAHAVAGGSGNAEEPMDIVVIVIDQNDNKPVFTQDTYLGEVPEASPKGYEVTTVKATDDDEPNLTTRMSTSDSEPDSQLSAVTCLSTTQSLSHQSQ
ncbi:protocadherin Fat 4-like protein [Lates japonicus]|uniref:Protocadherin Fat 4-like protein n=1 Tax=Lates japonicus TaxID=270547 RepID=A0AAD3RBX3_LATJO|nr:protocadherin Fat 4-like protein [Lates japonicus]